MNAAIEAAIWAFAQSRKDALGGLPKMPTPDEVAVFTPHMTSAIIAFLRNCDVSEGMTEIARDNNGLGPITSTRLYKAMAAKLATELEGK